MNNSHNTLKQWNLAVSADVKPLAFVAYKGEGYNLTYIEAQTAQHRANAYPKLVEALRNLADSSDFNAKRSGRSILDDIKAARAVLREFGE